MWNKLIQNDVKNFLNYNFILNSIQFKKTNSKYKNIDKNKIFSNINVYTHLKNIISNTNNNSKILINMNNNNSLSSVINNYIHNYINYKSSKSNLISSKPKNKPTIFIYKYTNQLYSSFLENYKLKRLITNGNIIKKMEVEKNQKKNDKITLINLKESIKYISSNKKLFNIIILKNTTNKLIKIVNFIKNKLIVNNSIFYFTPSINYSTTKFKKIKSIKRRLTKKYKKFLKN